MHFNISLLSLYRISLKGHIQLQPFNTFANHPSEVFHFQISKLYMYCLLPFHCVCKILKYFRIVTSWTVRGSNPVGGEIFRNCPDRPWGLHSLLYNGYQVFPGGRSGRSVRLTPRPLLVPWWKKGYSYTFTTPMGHTTCTEPQCLYKGALYFFLPSHHPYFHPLELSP
jgi:hypothetical protein